METYSIDNISIIDITKLMASGKIMIYPTDTILGIGCIGSSKTAVNKLFSIKKRDLNKPVSYLFPNLTLIRKYAQIPKIAEKLLKYLPGPITLILPLKENCPKLYGLNDDFIGVRYIDKPWLNKILEELHAPIITTSVNTSGKPSITQYSNIEQSILEHVDIMIKEKLLVEIIGSTIIKISINNEWKIIREGKLANSIKQELLRN